MLKGGGDRRTYGQSDQPTRLREFHMLYGTKNHLEFLSFPLKPKHASDPWRSLTQSVWNIVITIFNLQGWQTEQSHSSKSDREITKQ